MKKILTLFLLLLVALPVYSADQWIKTEPAGSQNVSDIDTLIQANNASLDRMVGDYRQGAKLKYNTSTSVSVTAGGIACADSGLTDVEFRYNSASVDSVWAVGDNGLDTGTEDSSTTYYVYADCDTDETGFKIKLSESASTPSGVTQFLRLGEFVNDSSSDITEIKNDDEYVAVSTGTISNGATIALPTGWAQDECNWTVAINAQLVEDGIGGSPCDGGSGNGFNCTVDSSRVVTCTETDGACGTSGQTANFIIACYR